MAQEGHSFFFIINQNSIGQFTKEQQTVILKELSEWSLPAAGRNLWANFAIPIQI